jgi:uncharacterized protein (TIGR03545 family)
LYWYEKIRPFLISDEEAVSEDAEYIRPEGRFVHFATDRPLPDLLIREVKLALQLASSETELGEVAVAVYDITHQQEVIGRPTRIIAQSQGLKDIKSLRLNGTLDHRQSPGKDSFDLEIQGMMLKNYDVGAMGLKLNHSQINVTGQAELINGVIAAQSVAQFNQAKFSSKDRTQVAVEMSKALAKVKSFDIKANAKGELTSPKVSISSDLDSQLNSAFNQRLKEKQKELEKQLEKKLNDKLLSYAGGYKDQLKAMNLANGSLADKQKKLQKLAKSELSSMEDQKKADAKRKVEEEKRKAQAKAKAAADKKRKQLEKEAKERFKKLF